MSHQVHRFNIGPVTAYAFNKDRTQIALCPNTNEVQVYKLVGKDWRVDSTLTGHDKIITSIDWAPESNRIVTCSQDRNAYVWSYDGSSWKPMLVLLRINRAATFVRWSPFEDKFAVASGARCISICYFEEGNDWWLSKHIKKPIRSTVLSVDWHPNNVILASGSADMKARVFSAFIKGLDKKPEPSVWGDKLPFNTVCGEYDNGTGAWVHSVAFSPSGDILAYCGHDSAVTVVYPATGAMQVIKTPYLPYLSLLWIAENRIVVAGHDCAPHLYETTDHRNWAFSRPLDEGQKKAAMDSTARHYFKYMDSRGQKDGEDNLLLTLHQNSITSLRSYAGSRDQVTKFSSSGLDGNVIIWDMGLIAGMAGMRI